jgi:hypothetical protein
VIAAETTLDPIQLIITQAGVAGAVVVLMIFGILWAKPSVMREFDKADAKDRQQQALIDTMLAVYHQEVLPTLADVDKRLVPVLETTQKVLQRVEALLDRMEREWDWRERRGRAEEESSDRRSGRDSQGDYRGGSRQGQRPGGDPSDQAGAR